MKRHAAEMVMERETPLDTSAVDSPVVDSPVVEVPVGDVHAGDVPGIGIPPGEDAAPASRLQHLMPGTLVLSLAAVVAWISFTAEPASAFVFPRVIAVVLLGLAVWNFARAALGMARVGSGVSGSELATVLPGLAITFVLCFFAARWLGFYTAGFLAFVAIHSTYDPAPHTELRSWLKRLIIAGGFMAVIYSLFDLLLQVQTPKGLFF